MSNLFGSTMLTTTVMPIASNCFMTFAWYAHLKNLSDKPWFIAALIGWGIALFEYMSMVPANRIGYTTMSLGQLKILREVITLRCSCRSPFSTWAKRYAGIISGRACV